MVRTKLTGKQRAVKSVPKKRSALPRPTPETVAGAEQEDSPRPTKATPKAKTPKTKADAIATPNIGTPNNQVHELSDADRAKIKRYLDNTPKPFKVTVHAPNRGVKRKRDGQVHAPNIQTDLFAPELSVQFDITPNNTWECLRRYKKFTVGQETAAGQESIGVGQCVLVKHDDQDEGTEVEVADQWKAKVLEVRALDSEHVYIRVAWLNRPEDLDEGRKPYHGQYELIPSNHMDIIDAMSVDGGMEVMEWDETADDGPMPEEQQFFWRQTFDARTRTLSKLRHVCVDDAPQNPDGMIIQCSSAKCRKWLHLVCIAEDAVKTAETDNAPVRPQATSNGGGKRAGGKKSKKQREDTPPSPPTHDTAHDTDKRFIVTHTSGNGRFFAGILLRNTLPHRVEDMEKPEESQMIFSDANGEREIRPLRCLFCQEVIEDE
ncbi:hypothetical protein MBLNU230_g3801t1 [Neophaeotheca triangularis]